eukprot:gene6185-2801_t
MAWLRKRYISSVPRDSGTGLSGRDDRSRRRKLQMVLIKGLPQDATEEWLLSIFQQFGQIQSWRIFRSSQKTGFGFVRLNSVEEAQAAVTALDGQQLGENVLEVKFADSDAGASAADRTPPPSDNLYVKNLPPTYGEEELRQLFSQYGAVSLSRVLHQGDQTGQGGAALVRMSTVDEAHNAVSRLNGQRVLGALNPLIVRFSDSAEIKARKQAKMTSNPNYHSHPRVAAPFPGPGGMRGGNYHQQSSLLNGQYAAPGGSDPSQQHLYLEDPNQPFTGHGNHPGGTGGRPGLAPGGPGSGYPGGGMPIANGGGHMMGGFGGVAGGGGYGMGAGNAPGMAQTASLYIKNLPLEGDKLMLYEKFSPFGAILSVKLLTDEGGASKGVGFINYADPISASKAVAALHNLPIGERHLHVAFQAPRSK